jgi:Asp-tRNA(Asn)/Glu-tRNA(Gln) amidotransferase A subunit family amidase
VVDIAGLLPEDSALDSRPLQGLKVGMIQESVGEGLAASVRDAVDGAAKHLESLGASIEEVHMPAFKHGLPAYYIIASSEASSNLSRYAWMPSKAHCARSLLTGGTPVTTMLSHEVLFTSPCTPCAS